jgi:hypothetical protein
VAARGTGKVIIMTTITPTTAQESATDLIPSLTRDQERQIILDIADPHRSLAGVADSHGLTLESITLWMTRPNIQKRIHAFEAGMAAALRLQVQNYLPLVVDAMKEALRSFRYEEGRIEPNTGDLSHLEQRRRTRETARKISSLLIRLATFGLKGKQTPTEASSLDAPMPTASMPSPHPKPTPQARKPLKLHQLAGLPSLPSLSSLAPVPLTPCLT